MLTTEPTFHAITWLSIRNALINRYGIRKSIADILIKKYTHRIDTARDCHRDCYEFTYRLIQDIKDGSKNGEFEKLLCKNWKQPCVICNGIKLITSKDDDTRTVKCNHCVNGLEPISENIF